MNELPGENHARADVESGKYECYRAMIAGDRVLDIGANVGYFTKLASETVGLSGHVIAFEPDMENFTRLVHRTMGCQNVSLVKAGAMDFDGTLELHHCPANCGAHSYFPGPTHTAPAMTSVVNIGRWVLALGFRPNFIKIDAEGSEQHIIGSLLKHHVQAHYTYEVHNPDLYLNCRYMLERASYEVFPKEPVVGVCWAIKAK